MRRRDGELRRRGGRRWGDRDRGLCLRMGGRGGGSWVGFENFLQSHRISEDTSPTIYEIMPFSHLLRLAHFDVSLIDVASLTQIKISRFLIAIYSQI